MKKLINILTNKNLTISLAESMTGGALSTSFTKHFGASKAFKGAIVAYDNDVKTKILNVNKETINNYSVVSQKVATEMVYGLNKVIDSDIYVSITGNAGPSLASETTKFNCFISILYQDELTNYELKFKTNKRNKNIKQTIKFVKNIVYNLVL